MGVGNADKADAGGCCWWLVGGAAKEEDEGVQVLDEILDRRRKDAIGQRRGLETIRRGAEEK